MTVFAFHPAHQFNAERVVDLHRLGYLPEPVFDPTYGPHGGMWACYRPRVLVTNAGVLDYRALPFPDGMFGSVLFDPPYRLAGTATNQGGMDDRYGVGKYRSADEIMDDIYTGAMECARLVRRDGFLITKSQAQVVSGKVLWQPMLLARVMEDFGFRLRDEVYTSSYRAQPGGRDQKHARRNYSTFSVFQR